jgi:hypothetical protein
MLNELKKEKEALKKANNKRQMTTSNISSKRKIKIEKKNKFNSLF